MITTEDIIFAINDLAVAEIPGAKLKAVYLELEPQNIERPCILIESVTTGIEDAARSLVETPGYFTITGYLETDAHGRSDGIGLIRYQTRIMDLFRKGYLKVGDRALRVSASTGGRDWDRCYVDIQLDYFDDRGDASGLHPPAGEVKVTVQHKPYKKE